VGHDPHDPRTRARTLDRNGHVVEVTDGGGYRGLVVDSQAAPRRQRNKEVVRARLLAAARKAFAEEGYDGATMDAIAAGADVARATVFNHFSRKEEILAALVAERRIAMHELLDATADQHHDVVSTLRAMFTELADWYEHDAVVNRAFLRSMLRAGGALLPGWFDSSHLFAEILREGQARGEVRGSVDPELAGLVLLDAYFGVLFRWSVDEADASSSLRAELLQVLELLLPGLLV
jgi:AcrR family transcriptional regulator